MCETRFVKCVRMRLPFRRPWDLLPYRRLYRGFSFVAFPILCSASPRLVSVPSLSSRFLFSLFLRVSVSRPSLPVSPRLLNLSTSRFSLRLLPSPTFTLLYLFPLFVSLRSSLFTSFFHPRLFTSPHLFSSLLFSSLLSSSLLLLLLPLSSLSEMPVETVFEKSRISLPAASCGVCFVFDANVVNFPLL